MKIRKIIKLMNFSRPVNVITSWIAAMVIGFFVIQSMALSRGDIPLLSSSTSVSGNGESSQVPVETPRVVFTNLKDEFKKIKLSELKEVDIPLEAKKERWVTVRMRVTAYCPCGKCCGKFSDGKTANGHHIRWGDRFVAAPKYIPFGTEMRIPGYNHGRTVKVADRGRVINGNRLDVFYNTHHTAGKWGVKYLDVQIKY